MNKKIPVTPNTYTHAYKAEWTDCDNYVLTLFESGLTAPVGTLTLQVFKTEHKGDAYLWNFHVLPICRGKGYGRKLLDRALKIARENHCRRAVLDWDGRDTPLWVYDWYTRRGFDESKIGRGCAQMVKPLKSE